MWHTSWVASHDVSPAFIVEEDEQRVGESTEPPARSIKRNQGKTCHYVCVKFYRTIKNTKSLKENEPNWLIRTFHKIYTVIKKKRNHFLINWRTHIAPYLLEWVHSEGNIHSRAIRQEGSQGCLLKQTKDQDLVPEVGKMDQFIKYVTIPRPILMLLKKSTWIVVQPCAVS